MGGHNWEPEQIQYQYVFPKQGVKRGGLKSFIVIISLLRTSLALGILGDGPFDIGE